MHRQLPNLLTTLQTLQANLANRRPSQAKPLTLNFDHSEDGPQRTESSRRIYLMATHSYTSRRELEQHSFHPAVTVLVPLAAILLQAYLPRPFPRFAILDLPLIITVFFAVSRRNPVAGTLTGACIGLMRMPLPTSRSG
jgi:hypothetical protein